MTAEIVDYRSASEFLFARLNYERTPARSSALRLDRMFRLLERLDQPHRRLRVVHVAGTKGKGSVCTLLAAALTAAGYRTGLYTSPHFHHLSERMQVDGRGCSSDTLTRIVRQVAEAAADLDASDDAPTFFELTTAVAMLHFVEQRVELAVLEAGLGGRFDSTNVCSPMVSVITSISFDHTQQLGRTLERIAAEKSGIIKPGRPVVSGVRDDPARQVVRDAAEDCSAQLLELGRDFDVDDISLGRDEQGLWTEFRYQGPAAEGRDAAWTAGPWRLGTPGRHQARNAALALRTLQALAAEGWPVSAEAARRALGRTRLPGRGQLCRQSPDVLLDVAHNVASVEALLELIDEGLPRETGQRRLVFATSRDKDAAGMLRRLLPCFDQVLLTRFCLNPRAVAPADLLAICERIRTDSPAAGRPELSLHESPSSAWQAARADLAPNDLLVAAGSLFLIAELDVRC